MSTHGYNSEYYQHHYHWGQSRLLCDLLINVSNRTRSTWLQSCVLSAPIPLTGQWRSINQCLKQDTISTCMFQQKPNYSQRCNPSGISVSTQLKFLQVRYELGTWQRSYKFCAVLYNVVKQSQYGYDGVIYIYVHCTLNRLIATHDLRLY